MRVTAAKHADATLAITDAARKYRLIDLAGVSTLYNDAKHATCSCVLNNMNTTVTLAVYILLIEASKYIK